MSWVNIDITTREEYDFLIAKGYEPLLGKDSSIKAYFNLNNQLRREIQKEVFPTKESFYKYCYAVSNKKCEETGVSIPYYSAINISHILSRGAHPAIGKDPRNFNLLNYVSHGRWETGDRKGMKIYKKNIKTMEALNYEYYGG